MNLRTLKGFRDFLPQDAIVREQTIAKIKQTFTLYGFDPLETPALEYADTLLGKYGDEADKLLYLFADRGGRKVGLRYDQTVPLARVIAQYPEIPKPFKRYQIQNVWRAENTQRGRYREFLQCDIDIVGEGSLLGEAEILSCVLSTMKNLGLENTKVLINDRIIFNRIPQNIITAIDKLTKIGEEGVSKELTTKGYSQMEAQKYIQVLHHADPTPNTKVLFKFLEARGYKKGKDFEFKSTLARGLDYYTGIIYELVIPDYSAGSLGGGGRYDKLIGNMSGKDYPAVGFSFGFDRILEIITSRNSSQKTYTQVYLANIASQTSQDTILANCFNVATKLRDKGVSTEVNANPLLPLDKQLKYADRKGIPYVLIIGENEIKENKITVKDLRKRTQKQITLSEFINSLKIKN